MERKQAFSVPVCIIAATVLYIKNEIFSSYYLVAESQCQLPRVTIVMSNLNQTQPSFLINF